ncbi:Cytochrome oxidase assembly factor-like protein [Hapsidospora chrysogenum ATCC 11550]|uniref:Cytochrome oxidase assembly factor-like protein n=1 Tax=Hapsidospora chrysogenum (strain ATCC 11550 / CBS 779.69 / DSM 880 / IAM 14645 / JCM 23072 / IMI 49137) TaxID=857340 RepID=A0A086TDT4_HAPC1|nr:Cytochrome oxidase assembly factor-like protein [Hapsidospora chrysogenum ATCC 11550]
MGSQASRPDQESSPAPTRDENEMVKTTTVAAVEEDGDDEPDEWYTPPGFQPLTAERARGTRDKRIFSTGCAEENAKMTDCYFEKKDWRACAKEMEQFKQCWKQHGNDERTESKDA